MIKEKISIIKIILIDLFVEYVSNSFYLSIIQIVRIINTSHIDMISIINTIHSLFIIYNSLYNKQENVVAEALRAGVYAG